MPKHRACCRVLREKRHQIPDASQTTTLQDSISNNSNFSIQKQTSCMMHLLFLYDQSAIEAPAFLEFPVKFRRSACRAHVRMHKQSRHAGHLKRFHVPHPTWRQRASAQRGLRHSGAANAWNWNVHIPNCQSLVASRL